MASKEPTASLIRVRQAFNTTCFISFAAPYSLDEEVTLPAGLVLSLREHEKYNEASPVDSKAWAPFIVSDRHRFDRNFRDSYHFDLTTEQVKLYCEPLDQIPEDIPDQIRFYRASHGCMFGTAVGDAIGLPYEGISPRRIQKLKPFPLRHRFFFGRGMLSDDTEHTCIVANTLILSIDDTDRFTKEISWSLRFWFLGLPAGIGMATLKACLKLWLFIPANKSGVYSAGNGPAMRSAILGVYAYDDKVLRAKLVNVNTRITHTDPKAYKGAMIIAEMAARNTQGKPLTPNDCLAGLEDIIQEDEELRALVVNAVESARRNDTAMEFCQQQDSLKKGVGGYIYHTLPVVLQIVLRLNDNYEQAISETIACGGDTDTVAAIVGGIVGANVGKAGIPEDWLKDLKDWPRDKACLHLLADELAAVKWSKTPGRARWMDPIRLWIRNAFFMLWVLAHGFRRLLPPY